MRQSDPASRRHAATEPRLRALPRARSLPRDQPDGCRGRCFFGRGKGGAFDPALGRARRSHRLRYQAIAAATVAFSLGKRSHIAACHTDRLQYAASIHMGMTSAGRLPVADAARPRSFRRRGSGRDPEGRRRHCRASAIAARSAAVAGTEPVEPAPMTGAFEPSRESRSASRRIMRSRRVPGSIIPRSLRCWGQASVTIRRNVRVMSQ